MVGFVKGGDVMSEYEMYKNLMSVATTEEQLNYLYESCAFSESLTHDEIVFLYEYGLNRIRELFYSFL